MEINIFIVLKMYISDQQTPYKTFDFYWTIHKSVVFLWGFAPIERQINISAIRSQGGKVLTPISAIT
jgi:hypothetical protein